MEAIHTPSQCVLPTMAYRQKDRYHEMMSEDEAERRNSRTSTPDLPGSATYVSPIIEGPDAVQPGTASRTCDGVRLTPLLTAEPLPRQQRDSGSEPTVGWILRRTILKVGFLSLAPPLRLPRADTFG
jgi:hypothetical protein